jgi:hypothetical protein
MTMLERFVDDVVIRGGYEILFMGYSADTDLPLYRITKDDVSAIGTPVTLRLFLELDREKLANYGPGAVYALDRDHVWRRLA